MSILVMERRVLVVSFQYSAGQSGVELPRT